MTVHFDPLKDVNIWVNILMTLKLKNQWSQVGSQPQTDSIQWHGKSEGLPDDDSKIISGIQRASLLKLIERDEFHSDRYIPLELIQKFSQIWSHRYFIQGWIQSGRSEINGNWIIWTGLRWIFEYRPVFVIFTVHFWPTTLHKVQTQVKL